MITHRNVVLSLTALAASLAGCGSKVPDTFKIGMVVALSGSAGARGKDLLRGAEMAAEEINAAGLKIAGKAVRVEIVPFDDKNENDEAAQGTKQLLASGVQAMIGPLNTPQAQKVIPVVAEAGLPHLLTNSNVAVLGLGKGNVLRLLANDDLQGRAAAAFVQDNLRAQRIVVIHEASDYGKGLTDVFATRYAKDGGKLGSVFSVDAKADVTTEIASRIKSENADVIVLFARDPELKSLFKSLQEVGHTKVTVVGSNVVRNANVTAAPIPVEGLYATATAIDAQEFHNGRQFLEAFEQKFKERPLWGAHYSYDAVHALAGAVASAETMEPAQLVQWLKTKELRTRVNHQMRFEGSDEQHYASIAVYKAERGSWQLQMRSSQW